MLVLLKVLCKKDKKNQNIAERVKQNAAKHKTLSRPL